MKKVIESFWVTVTEKVGEGVMLGRPHQDTINIQYVRTQGGEP